ncbi:MAG: type II toxin-antitoxin system VapC family toxin [Terriglobales bacterium]
MIAILRREPDAAMYAEAMEAAAERRMSAVNWVEAAAVLDGSRDPVSSRALDALMAEARVEIVPVTVEQAQMARAAYRDFGKGCGHPARLNLGDCFAYALAQAAREPLLYKGGDFDHTGIRSALPRA